MLPTPNFLEETRKCKNPICKLYFITTPNSRTKSCCRSCAVSIGNIKKNLKRKINMCAVCKRPTARRIYTYCSIKCQSQNRYTKFIDSWKTGLESGNKGITTRIISGHIRHYLLEKYRERCSKCGWNERNPITGKVPLEINHINGDSENSKEDNLELICPNCHALTPNFRNLNKGFGRKWRLDKIHTDLATSSKI